MLYIKSFIYSFVLIISFNSCSSEEKEQNNSAKINEEFEVFVEILQEKRLEPKKVAILTFDDGPSVSTKTILDVAKNENIPVSLFFIGSRVKDFKTAYKLAVKSSFATIANHTYSHANNQYSRFYSNSEVVLEDIKKAQNILAKDRVSNTSSEFLPVRLAGRNVYRLPNSSRDDAMVNHILLPNEILSYDTLFENGFYIYGWDTEWMYESGGRPTESIYEMIEKMERTYKRKRINNQEKVIVLLHEIMFNDEFDGEQNLTFFIQALKANGWTFQSIEEY